MGITRDSSDLTQQANSFRGSFSFGGHCEKSGSGREPFSTAMLDGMFPMPLQCEKNPSYQMWVIASLELLHRYCPNKGVRMS
jgi:hypothetical protein